jgi:hypothetical protein
MQGGFELRGDTSTELEDGDEAQREEEGEEEEREESVCGD